MFRDVWSYAPTAPVRIGATNTTRMPMMISTITDSISVKPCRRISVVRHDENQRGRITALRRGDGHLGAISCARNSSADARAGSVGYRPPRGDAIKRGTWIRRGDIGERARGSGDTLASQRMVGARLRDLPCDLDVLVVSHRARRLDESLAKQRHAGGHRNDDDDQLDECHATLSHGVTDANPE